MAEQPAPSAIDTLTLEFTTYCDAVGVPRMSAEELIHMELTPRQRAWVSDFILRWEAAAEADPEFYDKQTVVRPFWTVGDKHAEARTNWGEAVSVEVAHVAPDGCTAIVRDEAGLRFWLAWHGPEDDDGVWGMMDPDDHDTDHGAFPTLDAALAALPHYTPSEA